MKLSLLALQALQVLPIPVFVVDDDVHILEMNESAARMIGPEAETVLLKRGGEALRCLHAGDSPEGCGRGPSCSDCVVRNSVNAAFAGRGAVHQRAKLEVRRGDETRDVFVLVSVSPFDAEGKRYAALALEDLTEVVTSGNILPVCMGCKRIRQEGRWLPMEQFLHANMDLKVSHGICPVCMQQMYPEFGDSEKAH